MNGESKQILDCPKCGERTPLVEVGSKPNYRKKKAGNGTEAPLEHCSMTYQFRCQACGETFSIVASLSFKPR